jgi:hypothetical protein
VQHLTAGASSYANAGPAIASLLQLGAPQPAAAARAQNLFQSINNALNPVSQPLQGVSQALQDITHNGLIRLGGSGGFDEHGVPYDLYGVVYDGQIVGVVEVPKNPPTPPVPFLHDAFTTIQSLLGVPTTPTTTPGTGPTTTVTGGTGRGS